MSRTQILPLTRHVTTGPSDSSPDIGSKPRISAQVESDWAPILEFTSTDIFQHSPLGDVLNSLKSLSLSGDSWPNYVRVEWEEDDEGLCHPPTTHLISTVDDLINTLDYDSEDIDGMDDDAGDEHEPPPTGRWTATSSYDIYMVDTPKDNNGNDKKDPIEDKPTEKQPKRRRQRRRSKLRHGKNSDTDTKNNTLDNAKDNEHPADPAMKQDEQGDSEHSPRPLSDHSNA